MNDNKLIDEFHENMRACEAYAREVVRPWQAGCFVLASALASMVWLAYSEAKAERRF